MRTPDPIFEQEGEWFFWDETWSVAIGPYDSREEAKLGLAFYVEENLE